MNKKIQELKKKLPEQGDILGKNYKELDKAMDELNQYYNRCSLEPIRDWKEWYDNQYFVALEKHLNNALGLVKAVTIEVEKFNTLHDNLQNALGDKTIVEFFEEEYEQEEAAKSPKSK